MTSFMSEPAELVAPSIAEPSGQRGKVLEVQLIGEKVSQTCGERFVRLHTGQQQGYPNHQASQHPHLYECVPELRKLQSLVSLAL